MRLRIKECLEVYNEVNDTRLTIKDLAILAYKGEDSEESTKINRISALNTGRDGFVANLTDIKLLCEALDCGCDDIIEVD